MRGDGKRRPEFGAEVRGGIDQRLCRAGCSAPAARAQRQLCPIDRITGATWSAPVSSTTDFVAMDRVLGNDRVNNAPRSRWTRPEDRTTATLYITYANNSNLDGADVMFQRSTNQGTSFSRADPSRQPAGHGSRAVVSVGDSRFDVGPCCMSSYYDQGGAATGDLTETMYVFSDDGGVDVQQADAADRPAVSRRARQRHRAAEYR